MPEELRLPILRLQPRQQSVVWGGHLLSERLGKPASEEPIGESWEVWEGDPVENPGLMGENLKSLTERFPLALLGRVPVDRGWHRFPLLTKFIDANEPLSVQVHPDDKEAMRLEHQPNGKTEAWQIIEAEPGAWIIHGLTREIDGPTFRRLLESGDADELLRKVTVQKGDTVFVPARTIHAIGPGVLLHEVQQTSDVTYRLYDWNRQSHGSRRELHLDKGLSVALLKPSPNPLISPLCWTESGVEVRLILASEFFTVTEVKLPGQIELETGGASFHIVTVLSGAVTIEAHASQACGRGESVVIPAAFGDYRLTSRVDTHVLIECISEVDAIQTQLATKGFEDEAITQFLSQFRPAG